MATGLAFGGETSGLRPGWTAAGPAVQATRSQGMPSVLVVTRGDGDPASAPLCDGLARALASRPVGRAVLLAELDAREQAERVQALGVTTFPTVLVYQRDEARGGAVRLADYRVGERDPQAVAAWLDSLSLKAPAPARDDSIRTTQYGAVMPSAQGGYQPAPTPMFLPAPAPTVVPTMAAPAPAPVVVSPPVAPVVVTPPAQTIVIGPAPPPNVIYATTMAAAPAPTQLFLAPAPLPSGQQQQAYVAPAPQAQSDAAAPPTLLLAAPQPQAATGYYLAPQGTAVQSPVGTAVATMILTNPALWDKALGLIGQCLAKRGQPKVEMASGSPLMLVPTTGAGMAPLPFGYSPASAAPVCAPTTYALAPAPALAPNIVTATPQESHGLSGGGWLHKLKGR
jgi:hypothetical protein